MFFGFRQDFFIIFWCTIPSSPQTTLTQYWYIGGYVCTPTSAHCTGTYTSIVRLLVIFLELSS